MKRILPLVLALLCFPLQAQKLSTLPDAAALSGTEQIPIVQPRLTGSTLNTTPAAITTYVNANASLPATAITSSTLSVLRLPAFSGDCSTPGGSGVITCGSNIARTGVDVNTSNQVTATHLASPLPVPQGGMGLASGTSGGIPYFSSTTTIASSAALTASQILLGGGAGAGPVALGSLGTTTTVYHGNAAGNGSFGPVNLGTDVTSILPQANILTCAANQIVFDNTTPALACSSALTWAASTGILGESTTTPVNFRQTDTSASANTQIFQRIINGSAATGVLREQSCTGALVCADWITATRADAANPGLVDSLLLNTSSGGFASFVSISAEDVQLSASGNGTGLSATTTLDVGGGDVVHNCNLNLDCGYFSNNNSTGTNAFNHMQLSSGASTFELQLVPATSTGVLITNSCPGATKPVACWDMGIGGQIAMSVLSGFEFALGAGGFTPIAGAAGTTTATNGFFYIPKVAGVPTGVPANLTGLYAGSLPERYDSTDNRLYVYNGSWLNVANAITALPAHISYTGNAPTVSACGTGPAIDAHATDGTGTVTVGTIAAASCTVTFNLPYSTWNHCRVTSQSTIASFAYSYTLSVITVTGTSLVGDKFDYDCDGS